jgi:hypothetical protein
MGMKRIVIIALVTALAAPALAAGASAGVSEDTSTPALILPPG